MYCDFHAPYIVYTVAYTVATLPFKSLRSVFINSYFYSARMRLIHLNSNRSKVTQDSYNVTEVPLHGNFELRPLGATMGNASSVTRA